MSGSMKTLLPSTGIFEDSFVVAYRSFAEPPRPAHRDIHSNLSLADRPQLTSIGVHFAAIEMDTPGAPERRASSSLSCFFGIA